MPNSPRSRFSSASARFLRTDPLSRPWDDLSLASRRLVGFGFLLLMTMVVAVTLMMWELRTSTIDDARQDLMRLGIAIAEQTSRSFQAVEVGLNDIAREVAAQDVTTPQELREKLADPKLQAGLFRRAQILPQSHAFIIIDAFGHAVTWSRATVFAPIDVSDRDYFRYLRDHDGPHVFLSTVLQSRVAGEWKQFMARRLNGPSGNFIGIVVGSMDLDYFREFYKALTMGSGTSVSLLHRDGTMLTSYPETVATGEKLPPESPFYALIGKGMAATYMRTNPTLGSVIVAMRPVKDYPLAVNLSMPQAFAMKQWRQAAVLALIGTASAALAILLLLRNLSIQLQRLERSEASLAERNARLESQTGELQESRRRLAEQSEALVTTLDHMDQGIMMIDAARVVAVCNTRAIDMLELPPGLLATRPTLDAVVAHQRAAGEFKPGTNADHVGMGQIMTEPTTYERMRPNGRIIEIHTVPLATGGMVRTYTDITERRKAEAQVRYFAQHDDLTKLSNRMVFQERIEEAIDTARPGHSGVAVLYLDLDGFKLVNDSKGHLVGDKLLTLVAARLRSAVRDVDTIARMGGDEFAIIVPMLEQPAAAIALAERVLALMRRPFDIDGVACTIGISIGVAHFPQDAQTGDDLLKHADTALYRAKSDGRGVVRVFDADMDAQRRHRSTLEQDLHIAVAQHQFELQYQPIVDVRGGQVVCCEALLRWRHPGRGLVQPGEFIDIAERCGLIVPIGRWVLDVACAEAAAWPGDTQVAVNLSPVQFNDTGFADHLADVLAQTGLTPDRLILEVTEGLLLEKTDDVLATMTRLRTMGVRFGLDDFGTDHAGLSYLRWFPFDVVKIDKSFVLEMVEQPAARAIIAAVIGIGDALGMRVVAEGVETRAQLLELQRMGCKHVQGFLLGRPMPDAQIRQRLTTSHPAIAGIM